MENKYKVMHDISCLIPNRENVIMTSDQTEFALNLMYKDGWEFIGMSHSYWNGGSFLQEHWIFKRIGEL